MADLKVNITSNPPLNIKLQSPQIQTITMTGNVQPGTRNYDNLENRPQINDVTLTGNMSLSDLNISSENTTAGWEAMPSYTPKAGEVCLYSDTHRIKIGDGQAAIGDLPYVRGENEAENGSVLYAHVNNDMIHVSAEDRVFWDSKLNYSLVDERLIFNRN